MRRYPATRVAAAVAVLTEAGVPARLGLSGTGLSAAQLDDPHTRTSAEQLYTVLRHACRLLPDSDAAVRIGRRCHAATYGDYGLLLMSASSFRAGLGYGLRLHPLINPLIPQEWADLGDHLSFAAPPRSALHLPDLDEPFYRFLVQLQFVVVKTVIVDAMGADCLPQQATLAWPAPPIDTGLAAYLQCPVEHARGRSELRYARHWLERAPLQANALIEATMLQKCQQQLRAFQEPGLLSVRVEQALMNVEGPYPEAETLAPQLCISARTLRRRLQAEGTSYAQILASVRRMRADEYLCTTSLSLRAIAQSLGFADARSFSHAYKRWSGRTPNEARAAR
jgi:AraC-like DNA-binding protein